MPVIVVANPKGGVGKSTVSTNLAGYWASQGHAVMIGDADRQLSAETWRRLRPSTAAPVRGWDIRAQGGPVRPPPGTTHLVLDTPAGLAGRRLDAVLQIAHGVVVPLQPSVFDIHATHDFLATLAAHPRAAAIRVAAVGMRVRDGTLSAEQLARFAATLSVPMVTTLRDTQLYVQLAARGLSLWDISSGRSEQDRAQWQPLIDWLDSRTS